MSSSHSQSKLPLNNLRTYTGEAVKMLGSTTVEVSMVSNAHRAGLRDCGALGKVYWVGPLEEVVNYFLYETYSPCRAMHINIYLYINYAKNVA